jgi:hypothetical protein
MDKGNAKFIELGGITMKKENEVIELLGMQAEMMRLTANNIDIIAKKITDDKDLTRVGEVMFLITSLFTGLRLDLIVTKALNETKIT